MNNKMELYHYTTLESFWKMISMSAENEKVSIELFNIMHRMENGESPYGLSVLRRAIGEYESRNNIPSEQSKIEVPFFRNDRVMLVGPDKEMYIFPLSECPDNKEWWTSVSSSETKVAIGFDYLALVDYCISANLFLLKCKYDEAKALEVFVNQLDTEYDTFDYDEEHSRFSVHTKFFSMMYNACLEVDDPAKSDSKEWRLTSFASALEASYTYKDGKIIPFELLKLPQNVIKSICIQTNGYCDIVISGILGLLEKEGFDTEVIEIRKSAIHV